jgi:GAF domain-containing protein
VLIDRVFPVGLQRVQVSPKSRIFAAVMAGDLHFPDGVSRAERYRLLLEYLPSLLEEKSGRTANAANTVALLMQALRFHWIGFYFITPVDGTDELVLGPFQGPVACTRIAYGNGVCGTAWKQGHTMLVPDVDSFPGHIACSSASRSEIVVPVFRGGKMIGVLDIDSSLPDDFTESDRLLLEETVRLVSPYL